MWRAILAHRWVHWNLVFKFSNWRPKNQKDNKRVEQISLCGEFDQSILIIYRLFIDLRIDYCDLFKDQVVMRVLHVWSIFKQKEGNCGLNVLIFIFFYRN